MKILVSSQTSDTRLGEPDQGRLRAQIETLNQLVADLQRRNRSLVLEKISLRSQAEPTQARLHLGPAQPHGHKPVRQNAGDQFAARASRREAIERSGVHGMQRLGLAKPHDGAPKRGAADTSRQNRSPISIAPAIIPPLVKREPSLFVGGSIDIGIIPDLL